MPRASSQRVLRCVLQNSVCGPWRQNITLQEETGPTAGGEDAAAGISTVALKIHPAGRDEADGKGQGIGAVEAA